MTDPPSAGMAVYIVDDDAAMRDSLGLMLGLLGYRTASFDSAESMLEAYRATWGGCVVADLRLPGKSGLELQAELRRMGSRLPVILITAHGDVPSARAAFRSEAVDFLEKPFEEADLRAAIDKAFRREGERLCRVERDQQRSAKLEKLTRREREILDLVARGMHAKEIAASLAISPRTVEVHKARLMEKLEARNVAELVRFAVISGRGE